MVWLKEKEAWVSFGLMSVGLPGFGRFFFFSLCYDKLTHCQRFYNLNLDYSIPGLSLLTCGWKPVDTY
jgi:hypothetical protein